MAAIPTYQSTPQLHQHLRDRLPQYGGWIWIHQFSQWLRGYLAGSGDRWSWAGSANAKHEFLPDLDLSRCCPWASFRRVNHQFLYGAVSLAAWQSSSYWQAKMRRCASWQPTHPCWALTIKTCIGMLRHSSLKLIERRHPFNLQSTSPLQM